MNHQHIAEEGGISPQLLISVRDRTEVEDAIVGGADWVDFKEPRKGALGAVSFDQACQMVRVAAHRRPISAALGELVDCNSTLAQQLIQVSGIGVVKLGLAGCASWSHWGAKWHDLFQQAADHDKQLAAVIYADWSLAEAPNPHVVLETAIKSAAHYLLIDTWNKRSKSTLECFPPAELKQIVTLARDAGLHTVLAGNLRLADIPSAVELGTDLIAVRGAACHGSRTDKIDRQAIWGIKQAIADVKAASEKVAAQAVRKI